MKLIPLTDIYGINGKPLPCPSKADTKISGLQLFGERTADGLLHKQTVAYKRQVSLAFNVLTEEELRYILNMIFRYPIEEFYEFDYLDPQYGRHTIEAYTNEFSGPLYSAFFYNGLWQNVSFNCIER